MPIPFKAAGILKRDWHNAAQSEEEIRTMDGMDNTVIAAVISGAFALVGTLGGILASSKLTAYRIEQLEKKVDKHNSLVERVYRLEEKDAVVDEQIEFANHRISELERKV